MTKTESKKQIIWSNDLTRLTAAELEDFRNDLAEHNRDMYNDTREPEDYTDAEVEECIRQVNEDDYEVITTELGYDQAPRTMYIYADLGLWDGRHQGIKRIGAYLRNIFTSDCDYVTWYIERGNVKCTAAHHDGTNVYTYRMLKPGVSESSIDNLDLSDPKLKEKFMRLTQSVYPLLKNIVC